MQVTIRYTIAEDYYYVSGFSEHRPTAWLHIDRDHSLPFALYEVKSGREDSVDEEHPMVLRYAGLEGWPPRGSAAHGVRVTEALMHAETHRDEYERKAAFWRNEITKLQSRLAGIVPIEPDPQDNRKEQDTNG